MGGILILISRLEMSQLVTQSQDQVTLMPIARRIPTRTRTKLHTTTTTTTTTITTTTIIITITMEVETTTITTIIMMVDPTMVVVLPMVILTSWLSLLVKNHSALISN